ncbi:cobalamin biosynthesis protein [Rhodococcus sp. OK302]|uniref:cobalamin biosynthesis protein n=1 Tax=Rhodococcus sp. OK302 TaxID=1882769 RepID=UPI0020CBA985|nr:cobalamin biosynthesis protein [Rhodococcus sp. OK302]
MSTQPVGEVYVGVGFTTAATATDIVDAVRAVTAGEMIAALATITAKASSSALTTAADQLAVPVVAFESESLVAVNVPSPSRRVENAVGVASVAEAAAILAADHGPLVVGKTSTNTVTVAAARKVLPACTTIQK